MEKPWQYFWFTLAAMTVCALMAALLTRGTTELNLGSLADWFSGMMAAVASVTALYIATDARRRAALLLTEQKAEEARKAADAEVRLLKALLLVFLNGAEAVRQTFRTFKTDDIDAPAMARAFLSSETSELVRRCLDDISIHQLPSTSSVDALMACRQEWLKLMDQMKAIADDKSDPWVWSAKAVNTDKVDRIADVIADEIVFRGGTADILDDSQICLQINAAIARRDRATHAAAA